MVTKFYVNYVIVCAYERVSYIYSGKISLIYSGLDIRKYVFYSELELLNEHLKQMYMYIYVYIYLLSLIKYTWYARWIIKQSNTV